MATEFPIFVDLPDGETPQPGVHHDVDAQFLNALTGAVNTVENTLPGKVDATELATVAVTGAYTDLIGRPFIPDSPDDIGAQPAGDYATTAQLAAKADTASLHAVATSGSYNDLLNKPTIPPAYTDEQVRDVIGTALVAGTGVTITPDDAAETITIAATGGGGGAVDSVNGETGAVVLDAADVGAAPATHTHAIGDVTGLQAALDAKAPATVTANVQTGTTYTLVLADAGRVVEMSNASANTLTVPPNSAVAFPIGTLIEVYQVSTGQTTIAGGSGVTLRAPNGAKLASQYATASLRKRGTDEWVVAGDLTV